MCWPPSLSQLREQWPVNTVLSCNSPTEGVGSKFFAHFYFSHTIPIFSHSNCIQLNRTSVGRNGCPPSVNKGIKGPSLPYLPTTCLQKATAVSFPLLFTCPPPPVQFFAQLLFSNLIAIQSAVPATLPQSVKGTRASCRHSHQRVAWIWC
jgi:hypothetical protein